MKRLPLLIAVGGLAACAMLPRGGDDVYRAQAVATLTSLDCSRRAASALGYHVAGLEGAGEGTLRAERRFDDDGTHPMRGYLTMSVPHDPGDVMYVTGERIEEASRGRIAPSPGPIPGPTPPTPVPASRRTGPRRVSPGPVARDARDVLRRCAMGAIQEDRT